MLCYRNAYCKSDAFMKNIKEIQMYFDDLVRVALLFPAHIEEKVDLVWLAQETLRKYINFDDLVWVALLFHAHIEEIS